MNHLGPLRSALFVPGTRPDRIDKALATGADAVIIDLEDAVPRSQKAQTRETVTRRLASLSSAKVIVRVNGLDTEFFSDDIEQMVHAGASALIIPKVQSAEDVFSIHQALLRVETARDLRPGHIAIIALIETARGVENVSQIARTDIRPPRLYSLAFGAADYTLDLGIEITASGNELHYARSRLPIACRAAGLAPPLDTPFMTDLKDPAALQADALRARQLGFQGKLCIHPNQIEVVNRVFSPTHSQIQQALKVIEAFEAAEADGQAAVQVDGMFVDYPVAAHARRILKIAGAFNRDTDHRSDRNGGDGHTDKNLF